MSSRRAFTLVELLVVVAVIALLVGVLLPALGQAREAGRAAVCLSNMKQMAFASLNYAQAHKERLPSVGMSHGSHTVDEQAAWFFLLQPYCDSQLLYRCPSDRSPHWTEPVMPANVLRKVGFGTNYYVSGLLGGYLDFNRLAKLPRPTNTIYAVEIAEAGEFAAADHVHAETWFPDPHANASTQVMLERHAGRANYSFLDGHAAGHKFEETYQKSLTFSVFAMNNVASWNANKFNPLVAK